MDFVIGIVKVLIGTFVFFTITRVTYEKTKENSKWGWIIFVGFIAVTNMLVHRFIGSSINPPFFTAVWTCITVVGLTPRESNEVSPWLKRAIYAIIIGTLIGWLSYAETHVNKIS